MCRRVGGGGFGCTTAAPPAARADPTARQHQLGVTCSAPAAHPPPLHVCCSPAALWGRCCGPRLGCPAHTPRRARAPAAGRQLSLLRTPALPATHPPPLLAPAAAAAARLPYPAAAAAAPLHNGLGCRRWRCCYRCCCCGWEPPASLPPAAPTPGGWQQSPSAAAPWAGGHRGTRGCCDRPMGDVVAQCGWVRHYAGRAMVAALALPCRPTAPPHPSSNSGTACSL